MALIVSACRSPAGRFMGRLLTLSAPQLGAEIIRECIKRGGIRPKDIDEVIMGNVLSAGIGQNPARQAAIMAGVPHSVAAFTVNKVCASGMKSIALGIQAIKEGEADVVVAGGMESMSNAPYLLEDMRTGRRYGNSECIDSLIHDGLWDSFNDAHMGSLCELTVKRYNISREEQDTFAFLSHKKAMIASNNGSFRDELVPIRVVKGGMEKLVAVDETIRWDTSIERLSRLRPVFKRGGTITAGNSPGLNDGAAAVVLVSRRKAKSLKLRAIAEISDFTTAHLNPRWFPIAPVKSVERLIDKTGIKLGDFDLIEENEAFAAQTLAVIKGLNADPEKVNVNGGAIALGHPIGASGARIVVTLIHALRRRGSSLGLATICLGGGGAMSMVVRAL